MSCVSNAQRQTNIDVNGASQPARVLFVVFALILAIVVITPPTTTSTPRCDLVGRHCARTVNSSAWCAGLLPTVVSGHSRLVSSAAFQSWVLQSKRMRRIGELYHFWLHEAPLLTKMVTAATLFGTGDRIAQRIEAKTPPNSKIFAAVSGGHEPHDSEDDSKWVSPSTARTLRMMVWGGLFAAPIMHTWFHLIDHAIPGAGKLVVAKKVTADMMIIAPGTSLAFFTVTKCMEGEPVRESFQTAKAKLPPTLLADYMLWPAANALIFGLVPLHYRTPLTHCVSLVWSTFLSGMASHDAPKLTTPWSTGAPKPSVPSSAIPL